MYFNTHFITYLQKTHDPPFYHHQKHHHHRFQLHQRRHPRQRTSSSAVDACGSIFRKFMQETSLHGLKYITECKRSWTERLFWLFWIAVSWIFCGYLVVKVTVSSSSQSFVAMTALTAAPVPPPTISLRDFQPFRSKFHFTLLRTTYYW